MTSIQNNREPYSETFTHNGEVAFKISHEASSSGGTTKAQINLNSITQEGLDLREISEKLGQFTELDVATIEDKLKSIELLPNASCNSLIEVKIATPRLQNVFGECMGRKHSSNEKISIKIKPAYTPRASKRVKKAFLNRNIIGDGLTWRENQDANGRRFFEATLDNGGTIRRRGDEPPTGASKVNLLPTREQRHPFSE